jgi:hypothetical protein
MTSRFDLEVLTLDRLDAELVVERAAIIEYCANVPRAQAEAMALEQFTRGTRNVRARDAVGS